MRLAIVPERTSMAASVPNRFAASASNLRTVGSSPYVSSPSGASAIALRIRSVGRVWVSLRRLITLGAVTSRSRLIRYGWLRPEISVVGLLVVCTGRLGRRSNGDEVGHTLGRVGERGTERRRGGRLVQTHDRSPKDVRDDRAEQRTANHPARRYDFRRLQPAARLGQPERDPLEHRAIQVARFVGEAETGPGATQR